MRRKLTQTMLPIMIALGAVLAGASADAGDRFGQRHGNAPIQSIYPTPHSVPEWVGTTPYMYQPLYPHHWLSKHYDVYRRYDGARRIIPSNTTKVLYW